MPSNCCKLFLWMHGNAWVGFCFICSFFGSSIHFGCVIVLPLALCCYSSVEVCEFITVLSAPCAAIEPITMGLQCGSFCCHCLCAKAMLCSMSNVHLMHIHSCIFLNMYMLEMLNSIERKTLKGPQSDRQLCQNVIS